MASRLLGVRAASVQSLRASIRAVLADHSMRDRVASVARSLLDAGGTTRAADEIEGQLPPMGRAGVEVCTASARLS